MIILTHHRLAELSKVFKATQSHRMIDLQSLPYPFLTNISPIIKQTRAFMNLHLIFGFG